MDLTTITVDDFKDQFPRDFPYLPVWDVGALYNTGERVYYNVTELFYDALQDGVVGVTPDSGAPSWSTPVADNVNNYVLDSDIERAFAEARINFNQALYSTEEEITLVYLYLTAHYLVIDIQNATQGLESNSSYPVSSRSVGSVSESYDIPTAYREDPTFSYFSQTGYGLKYLSLMIPRIVGNVGVVFGSTTP